MLKPITRCSSFFKHFFAKRLLVWQYEKSGAALPHEAAISDYAKKIVDDAHMILKKTGKNVLEILKNQVKNLKE